MRKSSTPLDERWGQVAPEPFETRTESVATCIGAPLLVSRRLEVGAFDHPPPLGSQSITVLLAGRLRSGRKALRATQDAGDVRWASWQSNETHVAESVGSSRVQLVRLWLASERASEDPPAAHCVVLPRTRVGSIRKAGVTIRVLCGSAFGIDAPVPFRPCGVTFLEIELDPGVQFLHHVAASTQATLHIARGPALVNGSEARRSAGDIFSIPQVEGSAEGRISIRAVEGPEGVHAFLALINHSE